MKEIVSALCAIQGSLKAPKDQRASKYRYRNIEDVNEALKPLLAEQGCAVVYTDCIEGDLLTSTCTLYAKDGSAMSVDGCSYINRSPKNMSVEQACGAASSYARKYAACGLFAIDSSEMDPDRTEPAKEEKSPEDPLKKAKGRAWFFMQRYAELNGLDPYEVVSDVKSEEGFADTAEWWSRKADEFEEASNVSK